MNEIKTGVYLSPIGKLKVLSRNEEGRWIIDEGIKKKHPIFRVIMNMVKEADFSYPIFEERSLLKNCEWLGEL